MNSWLERVRATRAGRILTSSFVSLGLLVVTFDYIQNHQLYLCRKYGQAASLHFSIPAMTAVSLCFSALLAAMILARRAPVRSRPASIVAATLVLAGNTLFDVGSFTTFSGASAFLARHRLPSQGWPWFTIAAVSYVLAISLLVRNVPRVALDEYAERGY